MIAIDTNLLLYAFHPGVPEHASATAVLNAARDDGRGWGFAAASIAEFWSLVTRHPADRRSRQMATPGEAAGYFTALIDAGARVFEPKAGFGPRLLAAASGAGIRGRAIFDYQIALTARDGGATEIWTCDRGFVALSGLRILHPFLPIN